MSKRKERSTPEHLFAVKVFWNNKVLEAEVDTNQPPSVFKSQLFSLTNVLPENQKILIKGNILEDSVDWSTIGLKQGQKLKMMGTVVETVKSPKEASVNMSPAGLVNLGNSDYINSTIQCLHAVPELHSALNEYEIVLWNKTTRLTLTAKELFNKLSRSVKPVSPLTFVMDLCAKYPQYDEMNKDNVPMQQDAEECWTRVIEIFSQTLTSNSTMPVKEIFGIDLVCRVHCAETGEESLEEESVYSVKCNPLYNVNLLEGLNLGLKSKVERLSPKLGHSTVYDKESRINGLPRYLTVHFDRFIWDKEKNMKEKSLQKVEYPLELDVYELCSDELRKKLESCRQMSRYKLLAVLSHIGRCANSGHYIAWVKQESTGQWFSFDDHVVTPVAHEEITKLSGGGDGHMAYICLYKACL